jgi:spermidine/putrescine transport system permease protein
MTVLAAPAPRVRTWPGLRVNGWTLALGIYLIVFYAVLYGPLLMVVLLSFNDSEVTGFPLIGFTTKWYALVLSRPDLLAALGNSFAVGIVAASVATMLALLLSMAFRRVFSGQQIILGLVLLPIVLPGILGGIVLLIFFGYLGIRPGLYSTVLVAHVNWVLPFAFLTLYPRLRGFDKALEEAAMDLGARRHQVLRLVVLPIIRPAVIATFLFSFSLSFDEFIRTVFVTGFDRTVPVVFWGAIVDRLAPELPAMAVIIIAVSTVGSLCGFAISARARNRSH